MPKLCKRGCVRRSPSPHRATTGPDDAGRESIKYVPQVPNRHDLDLWRVFSPRCADAGHAEVNPAACRSVVCTDLYGSPDIYCAARYARCGRFQPLNGQLRVDQPAQRTTHHHRVTVCPFRCVTPRPDRLLHFRVMLLKFSYLIHH